MHSSSPIGLATTRVPFFKNGWQDTGYGYRSLANIIPAAAALTLPDSLLQLDDEVFAVVPGHPETVNYMRMWDMAGIVPQTHFAVALFAPDLLLSLPSNSPLPLPFSSTHPSFSTLSQVSGSLFEDYPQDSQLPEPAFGILGPRTTIPEACTILGISNSDIQRAKYAGSTPSAKQLVAMVRNYVSFTSILEKFGVSFDNRSHRFPGGLEVTLSSLLSDRGWTEHTYKKKNRLYSWAAVAATQFWHTPSPPGATDTTYNLYQKWRAICFIWAPNGPIDTGDLNSLKAADLPTLTQANIEAIKLPLSLMLVDQRST
ncbi:hypothetical protein C8R47DRAFT_1206108 [Mycena vitilis]|nr:hypothetical protein C8R47DRAFT_1206108 [Mycena vitilis]